MRKVFDPFQGAYVEVGKASYPRALPVPSSTGLRPRTPQGKYVGHANDLTVVHLHPRSRNARTRLLVAHGSKVGKRADGLMTGGSGARIGVRLADEDAEVGKALRRTGLARSLAPYTTKSPAATVNRAIGGRRALGRSTNAGRVTELWRASGTQR